MLNKLSIRQKALQLELSFDIYVNQLRDAGIFIDKLDEAYYNRDLEIIKNKNSDLKKVFKKDKDEEY
jgi:hypothetical protein